MSMSLPNPIRDVKPSEISRVLIQWYEINRRELPWRETSDPYKIWISEVILQQTRVAQGLKYYNRFVERFPDVSSLAEAGEDELMKMWQGLGYYSRARNLHTAACEIVERYAGVFPTDYHDVRSLKGIGDYTAAAICSFAYNQPYATVDGNVYRVLARLFGIDLPIDTPAAKRRFAELATDLLDRQQAALHNQAMMEFGALQCVPRSPECTNCPLAQQCVALRQESVEKLPVKAGRTAVKPRYFNYLYLHCGEQTVLVRRTGQDIWKNLYEFPLIETEKPLAFEQLRKDPRFPVWVGDQEYTVVHSVSMPKHQLSHRTIYANFYEIGLKQWPESLPPEALMMTREEITRYPVSRLTELYLQQNM